MTGPNENATPGQVGGADQNNISSGNDSAIAVDLNAAHRFLGLLDETGESFHSRTFPDQGRGGGRNFTGSLDNIGTDLQLDNGKGRGVFVVINEGGQTDAEITRVRAVFADFDGTPMPEQFPIEPQIIVESSPGKFHAYWFVDGLPVESFKPTQQAIAAMFGSDPAVCNPSRVMRLPGFVHRKGKPFVSRVIHESGGVPYAPEQVLAAFPAIKATTPLQAHVTATGERVVDTERHGDLLKLSGRIARQVHFDGLAAESALAMLYAEAERGRWTRDVPREEIKQAFEGALAKCRNGEWRETDQEEQPSPEDEVPPLRLVEVSIGDVMAAHVDPPSFVFDPIIPHSHVTLFGGHGGAGKSNLALVLAAHAVCGKPWAGREVLRCKAVFVSLEDSGALVRYRLRKIIEAYRLDADAVAKGLRILDGSDASAALMTEVNEFGSRKLVATPTMLEIEEAVAGAGLVVIDNASDAFDGDENNRRQVRTFIRRLAGIAKANEAGVVLLAHIDKQAAKYGAAGNSYSGSTAWHNSARSRLALVTDEEGNIELRHEKSNLSKLADPIALGWSDSGVIVPRAVDPVAAGASEDVKAAADAEAVLEVIRAAVESGNTITTAVSGPHQTPHALEAFPELGKSLRGKDGRKRIRAAVVKLHRDGKIVRATYTNASRNVRECWQPSELTQGQPADGEKSANNLRWLYTPIPPLRTNAQSGDCVSSLDDRTDATNATNAADYRAAKEGA